MPRYQVEDPRGEMELLPDETFMAEVEAIEAEVSENFKDKKGNPLHQFKITYRLHGDGAEDATIFEWATITTRYKPDGSPPKWLERLHLFCQAQGLEIPRPGESYDPDDLIGAKCRVDIVHKVKDDGTKYHRVGAVKPRRAPKPTPQTQEEPNGQVENAHLPPAPKGTVNQTEYD